MPFCCMACRASTKGTRVRHFASDRNQRHFLKSLKGKIREFSFLAIWQLTMEWDFSISFSHVLFMKRSEGRRKGAVGTSLRPSVGTVGQCKWATTSTSTHPSLGHHSGDHHPGAVLGPPRHPHYHLNIPGGGGWPVPT